MRRRYGISQRSFFLSGPVLLAATLSAFFFAACAANKAPVRPHGDGGLDGALGDGAIDGASGDLGMSDDLGGMDDGGADAGPVATVGMCGACTADTECLDGRICREVATGSFACVPTCDPDLPSCLSGFYCTEDLAFGGFFCAPLGGFCCVDHDGDLHGEGIDCVGTDCSDGAMCSADGAPCASTDTACLACVAAAHAINSSASEICNGTDDNCDGTVDEPPTDCTTGRCGSADGLAYSSITSATCVDAMCGAGTVTPCGFFTCESGAGAGTRCATSCDPAMLGDDDRFCVGTAHCDLAACIPDLSNGTACNEDTDCSSAHCENGYCCDSGRCCVTATDCDATGTGSATVCTNTATCQGARGEVSCTAGFQCDVVTGIPDDSACTPSVRALECGLYLPLFCSGLADQPPPACPTSCADDAACVVAAHCESGSCVTDRPAGGVCARNQDCTDGLSCADGVCCDTGCSGTCQACNLPGSVGRCSAVPVGNDPDSECLGFSCGAYFDSFDGFGRCYGKRDVDDTRATCNGSGACLSAATLCPAMLPGAVTIDCNDSCQAPVAATCVNTTAGRCDNLDDPADLTTCGLGACQRSVQRCVGGLAAACVPGTSTAETCNNIDDNCNGIPDDGSPLVLCPRPTNATATRCDVGTCVLDNCASGFGNCDAVYSTGCETSLNSLTNCGTCGTGCSLANANATCATGSCAVQSCDASWGNCDGSAATGCETRLDTLSNCGACGNGCSLANATETCSTGTCTLVVCDSGFGNCDGGSANGCETALNALSNCGGCGVTCNLANATESCSTGTCTLGVCNPGYGDCDGDPSNGCETHLNSLADCGGCGTSCALANATESCTTGTCALTACVGLYRDCDGNAANGCERPINTLTDCGACNAVCDIPAATETCGSGTCVLASCGAGLGDCNGVAGDGCETMLNSTANCGGCAVVCDRANAAETCPSGTCTLGACTSGYGNCDTDPTNGCETAINTVANCGTCGTICNLANATEACTAGACAIASCSAGFANCDANPANGCETPTNTLTNCGGCGLSCARANAAESCSAGACTLGACDAGFGNCDGNALNGCETALNTLTNCGGCGAVCDITNASESCSTGSCQLTACTAGFGNCDGGLANGCETALNTLTNCAGCGATCARANAAESCSTGACTLGACDPGYGNCDGDPSNGCETPLNTLGNCGGCGTLCDRANATETCPGGVCTLGACTGSFGNCNANPTDGCEAPLTTTTNCGACAVPCAPANGTGTCATTTCAVATCNANYTDVDGTPTNGCECLDEGYPSACASAASLGSVAMGGNATASGKTPAASSPSDWFYVDFPGTGGTPSFSLTVNDGSLFRFDVQLGSCAGGSSTCGEGGSSTGLTTWSFVDNASVGFTRRLVDWPVRIYVRVFRITSGASCGGYTLRVTR